MPPPIAARALLPMAAGGGGFGGGYYRAGTPLREMVEEAERDLVRRALGIKEAVDEEPESEG